LWEAIANTCCIKKYKKCTLSNLQLPLQILGKKLKEFILVVGEKELSSRRSLQDGHGAIPEKNTINKTNEKE
jgi:hypothetical protein